MTLGTRTRQVHRSRSRAGIDPHAGTGPRLLHPWKAALLYVALPMDEHKGKVVYWVSARLRGAWCGRITATLAKPSQVIFTFDPPMAAIPAHVLETLAADATEQLVFFEPTKEP